MKAPAQSGSNGPVSGSSLLRKLPAPPKPATTDSTTSSSFVRPAPTSSTSETADSSTTTPSTAPAPSTTPSRPLPTPSKSSLAVNPPSSQPGRPLPVKTGAPTPPSGDGVRSKPVPPVLKNTVTTPSVPVSSTTGAVSPRSSESVSPRSNPVSPTTLSVADRIKQAQGNTNPPPRPPVSRPKPLPKPGEKEVKEEGKEEPEKEKEKEKSQEKEEREKEPSPPEPSPISTPIVPVSTSATASATTNSTPTPSTPISVPTSTPNAPTSTPTTPTSTPSTPTSTPTLATSWGQITTPSVPSSQAPATAQASKPPSNFLSRARSEQSSTRLDVASHRSATISSPSSPPTSPSPSPSSTQPPAPQLVKSPSSDFEPAHPLSTSPPPISTGTGLAAQRTRSHPDQPLVHSNSSSNINANSNSNGVETEERKAPVSEPALASSPLSASPPLSTSPFGNSSSTNDWLRKAETNGKQAKPGQSAIIRQNSKFDAEAISQAKESLRSSVREGLNHIALELLKGSGSVMRRATLQKTTPVQCRVSENSRNLEFSILEYPQNDKLRAHEIGQDAVAFSSIETIEPAVVCSDPVVVNIMHKERDMDPTCCIAILFKSRQSTTGATETPQPIVLIAAGRQDYNSYLDGLSYVMKGDRVGLHIESEIDVVAEVFAIGELYAASIHSLPLVPPPTN